MAEGEREEKVARDAYEALAEAYAAAVDTKPHNAYYERPATLSLLPDVSGRRVLDAGCGPGVYVEWLLEHGAEVVGFDVSETMVRLARQRVGDRAEIVLADLGAPLCFAGDQSFDVVISALALDYVRDWRRVLAEFHRVLCPSGWLIFSMGHPFSDFVLHGTDRYFDTELIEYTFIGFGSPIVIPGYRRSLSEVINSVLDAGFEVDRVLEPLPTDEFRVADPQKYRDLLRRPGFLCVRARTSSGA
jgi:SAM-dependent methyltransferase